MYVWLVSSRGALLTRSTLASLLIIATCCKETQRHGHHADAEGYRCLQVRTLCIWTACAISMCSCIYQRSFWVPASTRMQTAMQMDVDLARAVSRRVLAQPDV